MGEAAISTNDGVGLIEANIEDLEKEIANASEDNESTNTTVCKEQRQIIKEKRDVWKLKVQAIKAFRETNKTDMLQVEKLKAERLEKQKSCNPNQIRAVPCEIPQELLQRQKELNSQMMEMQTELASTENANKEEFIAKYKPLKEEYKSISDKINTISGACKQTERVFTQESICKPDAGLMQEIEKIKKSLQTSIDEKETFELKRALEYSLQKMNTKCGIDSVQGIGVSNTQPISETEMLKKQIADLKSQIQSKDREIQKLKESMMTVKDEMKNAGQERKTEVLEANADKIVAHTIALLDKRIDELKMKISSIESAKDISEEEKSKLIERLNNRIADLELAKSEISDVSTPQELRQTINNARISENQAIIENKVVLLKRNTTELSRILETYYKESNKYNQYVQKMNDLLNKISLTSEKATIAEVDAVVKDYKNLKEEIISEGRNIKLKTEVEVK